MSANGMRKRRAKFFVQVDRGTVRDGLLQYQDLGVLTYLLDQPDGYDVRAEALARTGPKREGRDAIRKSLVRLGERGYYRLERRRLLDGTFAMGTAVSEEPVASWAAQHKVFGSRGVPVFEQKDGSFLVKYPDGSLLPDDFPPPSPDDLPGSGFSGPGQDRSPGTGFPASGEPESGEPGTGEPSPKGDASEEMHQERENPPPSPSSATDGGRSTAAPEEEEADDPNLDDNRLRAELVETAREVLETVQRRAGLRAARRLAPLQVTELAGLLAPALAAGWTADDAADALDGELDTADNLFGVLRRRVRDLTRKPAPDPATARPRAGRPPTVPVVACTTCDPHNPGWLDVDGPARKCPICVPGKPGRMYAAPA